MPRVTDEDDPKRCRGTATKSGGQCRNKAAEDSDYCLMHGGRHLNSEHTKAYLIEQFERRLNLEVGPGDETKLLRENLMNLCMVIAARTNLMQDEASMLAHSGPIADLVMKAEKVTVSLQRLALSSGELLARPALITWGQEIIAALADTLTNKYDGWEEDLMSFGDKVASIIVQVKNKEEEK